MKAVILGNGLSRKNTDYRKSFPDAHVYGCNGAYNEDIDFLVCVDIYMQHIIYESGYCKDNTCYFNEWTTLPTAIVGNLVAMLQYESEYELPLIYNPRKDKCVIRGTERAIYITHVEDEDKVIPIIDEDISSGSRALKIACQSGLYNEIYLLGFDGVGHDNIYINTKGYENSTPRNHWVEERNKIMKGYPNIRFVSI